MISTTERILMWLSRKGPQIRSNEHRTGVFCSSYVLLCGITTTTYRIFLNGRLVRTVEFTRRSDPLDWT